MATGLTKSKVHKNIFIKFSPVVISTFFFLAPAQAGTYTDSAHGNSDDGVMRNPTSLEDYSKGNCSHCHEQHASIDGTEPTPVSGAPSSFAIFADNFNTGIKANQYDQDNNFCFFCHANDSSLQENGIDNKDYAATFAGYSSGSPLGIFEAFNQHSYHNLYDIWVFAKDEVSFSSFTDYSNPCTACHNPHIAKRNRANVQDPSYTALSKPSDHGNLWGDDADERMNTVGDTYQPPLYYNSNSTYEPGGTATDDGSLTPDYNAFCLDCHDTPIYSNTLGKTIEAIDWYSLGGDAVSAGDKHGANFGTAFGETDNPYNNRLDLVLSCLDCHEPHGSPSSFLIRQEVNGDVTTGDVHTEATSPSSTSTLELLCARCHNDNWQYIHHPTGSPEAPYIKTSPGCDCHPGKDPIVPIPCEECHSHGSSKTNCDNTTPAIRKTF